MAVRTRLLFCLGVFWRGILLRKQIPRWPWRVVEMVVVAKPVEVSVWVSGEV